MCRCHEMLRTDCKTGGLTSDYFLHFNQTKYWFDEQQKRGQNQLRGINSNRTRRMHCSHASFGRECDFNLFPSTLVVTFILQLISVGCWIFRQSIPILYIVRRPWNMFYRDTFNSHSSEKSISQLVVVVVSQQDAMTVSHVVAHGGCTSCDDKKCHIEKSLFSECGINKMLKHLQTRICSLLVLLT